MLRPLHACFGRRRREAGLLLASATGGGGGGSGFSIASTPATSTATKVPLNPNFVEGPLGLDPYRPWSTAVIDGELFIANGWDPPKRWDRAQSTFMPMGSTAPTTFALALSAAGVPAAIPTGQTARYYVVGYNSTLDKETAPQGGTVLTIANASGATRDVTVTWTASEFAAEYDYVRIYRALYQTDDFKRVNGATGTAVAAGTFLDTSPDATLRALASTYTWDGTIRTTVPPNFVGIVESQGYLLGWEKSGDFLRYSRGVRVLGTYVADDFPEENVLQIGADEGTGSITAVHPYHRSNVIWKRGSIYEMAGDDISNWSVRGLTTGRGTFNQRTVVAVDRWFLCLDHRGIYKFTPGLYAGVPGSVEEMYYTPMQPVFDRMNLSASDTFHSTLIPASGVVIFWVALDYEPTPNTGIVFDYGTGKFRGIYTRKHPTFAGFLDDALGVRHACFGDDMGYLWEDVYGESEGVFAGSNTSTVTSGSSRTVTSSGASYSTTAAGTSGGAPGTPMDRYDANGVLIDENRVFAATTTTLTTYLFPSAAVSAGDAVAIGVIPGVIETRKLSFASHQLKAIKATYLEFASGVSGSVRIDTALDDDDFVLKCEQSLATEVRATIWSKTELDKNHAQCWYWQLRISQRYANLGFSIRAVHIQWDLIQGRLK